ncbi:carbohydrate kinase [Leucobacter sp. CSA1]|uniref:Carbohydrate kinase n=2 Tax=Leucobacter chromiisoli TaxID=2796471 RepID=A0A934Q624_9MICO|nr:carbohydrate kinase [Leucobacter chromiisoli]
MDIMTSDGETREFIGGSPANAAVGVARLGHSARLLTRLGRDPRGERIAAHLEGEAVELLPESWREEPTSTAQAIIAADGSATYHFDISWEVPSVAVDDVDLVHAGSIALFLEPGGSDVLRLLREFAPRAIVTVDPNIRPSLLPDHAVALRRFEDAAAVADLVKLSDEDAEWLYPGTTPEAAAERIRALGPAIVVVTLGAEGALALNAAGRARIPAHPVDVVDTISAGDSVMASLISSLLERGVELSQAELATVLDRAARAAAIAVSVAGANPPLRAQLEDPTPLR